MAFSNQEIRKRNSNRPKALNRAIQGELAALESDLTQKFLDLYVIIRQFGMPIDFFKSNTELRFQIQSMIRRKVQQSYLIGIDTVGNQYKRRVKSFELFISGTDVNTIKTVSQAMVNRYWTTTEKLLIRETATTEQDNEKLEKKAFDIESAYQRIASFTVYKGYNQAVRTKLETAIPAKGLETEVATGLTAAFSLKKIFKGGLEKLKEKLSDVFGDKLGLNRLQELELQEMFLTKEDEKVDPRICEPLNRRLFSVDDPDKPDLPMHDWCRCILVPIAGEEAHFTGLDIEI